MFRTSKQGTPPAPPPKVTLYVAFSGDTKNLTSKTFSTEGKYRFIKPKSNYNTICDALQTVKTGQYENSNNNLEGLKSMMLRCEPV